MRTIDLIKGLSREGLGKRHSQCLRCRGSILCEPWGSFRRPCSWTIVQTASEARCSLHETPDAHLDDCASSPGFVAFSDMVRLVLFDIDGTLVRTGGAGVKAFAKVFETEFNT